MMLRAGHPNGRLVTLLSWLIRPASLGSLLMVMGSLVADQVETRTSDPLAQARDRVIVAMGRQLVESDLQAVGEQVLTLARLESIRDATAHRPASEEKVERIQEAARAGDQGTLESAAHGLKGSCGKVGARGAAEWCRRLEAQASSGSAVVDAAVRALRDEWDGVRTECLALVAREGVLVEARVGAA